MFCCMCCMCVACVSMFSLRRNTNVHKVIKILRGIIIIMCMQDFLVKFDLSLSQTEKVRCQHNDVSPLGGKSRGGVAKDCSHCFQVHPLVLEMVLGGVSPRVVEKVLSLAHSVQPHKLSAVTLYEEALVNALSAFSKAQDLDVAHLEVILKSISRHENEG